MNDHIEPNETELRAWACDADADWPVQDYDLMVVLLGLNHVIIELAADNNCPKQRFFLSCCYLIVGDAVRTEFKSESKQAILHFLNLAEATQHAQLLKFVARSEQLLADPSLFDYDLWCDGGLVGRDE